MAKITGRPNESRAQVVEHGITIQANQGARPAAKFLDENRVPFGTIVRVLSDEGRRRGIQKKPPL